MDFIFLIPLYVYLVYGILSAVCIHPAQGFAEMKEVIYALASFHACTSCVRISKRLLKAASRSI
jgi:uncharacterized membrane protein